MKALRQSRVFITEVLFSCVQPGVITPYLKVTRISVMLLLWKLRSALSLKRIIFSFFLMRERNMQCGKEGGQMHTVGKVGIRAAGGDEALTSAYISSSSVETC